MIFKQQTAAVPLFRSSALERGPCCALASTYLRVFVPLLLRTSASYRHARWHSLMVG